MTLIIYCLIRNLGLKEWIEKQGEFWKANDDLDKYEEMVEKSLTLSFEIKETISLEIPSFV